MWFLLPMVASIGLQAYGQYQAGKAAVEGAEAQASMERMNQEYQNKMFLESIEYQKPFYEAGEEAIGLYEQAITGERDPLAAGIGRAKMETIEPEIRDMSSYVQDLTRRRIAAEEGEAMKGRLLDIQQIGQGQAQAAGRSALNLGTALSGSMMRTGTALAQAGLTSDIARQNIFTSTLESLSGLPAYFAAANRNTYTAPQPVAAQPTIQNLMPGYTAPAPMGWA